MATKQPFQSIGFTIDSSRRLTNLVLLEIANLPQDQKPFGMLNFPVKDSAPETYWLDGQVIEGDYIPVTGETRDENGKHRIESDLHTGISLKADLSGLVIPEISTIGNLGEITSVNFLMLPNGAFYVRSPSGGQIPQLDNDLTKASRETMSQLSGHPELLTKEGLALLGDRYFGDHNLGTLYMTLRTSLMDMESQIKNYVEPLTES